MRQMTGGIVLLPGTEISPDAALQDPQWDLEVLMAAAQWALRLMRRSLLGWLQLSLRCRNLRARSVGLAEHVVSATRRRTLQRWKLAARAEARYRSLAQQMPKALISLLRLWNQTARLHGKLHRLQRTCGVRERKAVLDAWKLKTAQTARQWRCLALQQLKLVARIRSKVLAAWRAQASLAAGLRRLRLQRLQRLQRFALTRFEALGAWRQLSRLWRRTRLEMKTYKRSMLSTLSHWKWLVSAEASLRALSCMQAKQAVRSSFSCWRLRHRASLKQTQMRTQMTGRCQQDLVASVRRWHCLVLRRLMASTHFYCLQAMMRLWHQVMKLSRVSRASKKQTVSDAFTLWRCLTMREIARRTQSKELITLAAYSGDGDSSMEVSDLLEVSATTYATNSGRDTSGEQCDTASAPAALDINRSLSDLSGLSVHSPEPQPFGASPEPTAFEVSPIPFSPFSKVSPRSRSLAIPSPARSRQPTPDRSDGCDGCDGTDWCTPVTPVSRGAKLPDAASGCKHCEAKPGHGPDHWKSEAKMVQAELWQTERNERCLIEAMRCWLSQCLQRRLQILAVQQAHVGACRRHLSSWRQLCTCLRHRQSCLLRCSWEHWQQLLKQCRLRTSVAEERAKQHRLVRIWRCWRMAANIFHLAVGQSQWKCHNIECQMKIELLCAWRFLILVKKQQSFHLNRELSLMASCHSAWRCYSRRMGRAVKLLRRVSLRASLREIWRLWQHFRLTSKLLTRMVQLLEADVDDSSPLSRREALRRWAAFEGQAMDATGNRPVELFVLKRMRNVQRLAGTMQLNGRRHARLLSQLLHCWRKVCLVHAVQLRSVQHQIEDLNRAFSFWIVGIRLMKSLQLQMYKHRRGVLCRALACWMHWQGRQHASQQVREASKVRTIGKTLQPWRFLQLAVTRNRTGTFTKDATAGTLLAWRAGVRISRQQRQLLWPLLGWRTLAKRACRKRLRCILRSWLGCSAGRAAVLRNALSGWQAAVTDTRRLRMLSCFTQWQRHYGAAQCSKRLRIAQLMATMNAWQRIISRHQAQQQLQTLHCGREATQVLRSWSSLQRSLFARKLLWNQLLRATCSLWRLCATLSHAEHSGLQRALNFWRAALLMVHLQLMQLCICAWRACSLAGRVQHHRLRQMFRTWIAFQQQSRQCRVSSCFTHWRMLTYVLHSRSNLVGLVWTFWLQSLADTAATIRKFQLHQHLQAWQRACWGQKAERALCKRAMRAWLRAVVAAHVAHSKMMRRSLFLWHVERCTTKVFDSTWSQWWLAVKAWKRQRLRRCLRLWRTCLSRELAAFLGAWRVQVSIARVPRVFHAWRAAVLLRRACRMVLAFGLQWWHLVSRRERSSKCTFWACWIALLEAERHMRLRHAMTSWRFVLGLRRLRCYILREVFGFWVSAREVRMRLERKMQRFWQSCERGMVMAAAVASRSVADVFQAWRFCGRIALVRREFFAKTLQESHQRPIRLAFDSFKMAHMQRRVIVSSPPVMSFRLDSRMASPSRRPLVEKLQLKQLRATMATVMEAWLQELKANKRRQVGLLQLHRLVLSRGFLPLQVQGGSCLPSPLAKGVAGTEPCKLHRLGAALLRSWHAAARRSFLSAWMLRWRCSAAGKSLCHKTQATALLAEVGAMPQIEQRREDLVLSFWASGPNQSTGDSCAVRS
ncbi:unnamed protein product [Effrenium voratum]|nr:unnamed protein product [Effrenium voratum]